MSPSGASNRIRLGPKPPTKAITPMWGSTSGGSGFEQDDAKKARQKHDDGSSDSSSSASDLRAGTKSKERRPPSSTSSTPKKQKKESEKQRESPAQRSHIIHANRLDNDSLLQARHTASGTLDSVADDR